MSSNKKTGDIESMFKLAGKYAIGDGVKKDPSKSLKLYQAAAAKGHKGAQVVLGRV